MTMDLFTIENTKEIFYLLELCESVEQNIKYHPEGNVLNHSLQVMNHAFRESDDTDLILAAMLHDVGKCVESHGHAEIGIQLLREHVSVKTLFLIEHHMRIWAYLEGEMSKLSKCQFLASHPWLSNLIQLARWDRMGRNPNSKIKYDKEYIIERLNKKIPAHFKVPGRLYEKNITSGEC